MPGFWRTPLDWSTGVMVTDAMMDQHVRDQLSALKNDHMLCCGRMTLASFNAVPTSDVTAATTLYFTPYIGNIISLHDGDNWQPVAFSQLSIALGSDAANANYDLFAYYTSGAAALERTAWTNSTTRAVALTLLDGILVKSSNTTRRYLGTYRTTAVAGQCEDSTVKRFVWNYYHRQRRRLLVTDSTDTWTYTTAAFRQANGAATNRVEVVIGVQEALVCLHAQAFAQNSAGGPVVATSIGMDSTTASAQGTLVQFSGTPVAVTVNVCAVLENYPPIGLHQYNWLEYSTTGGTTTWYGDAGGSIALNGMTGWVEG
jgi:hypothetical protein